jgi:hypothetical protein
MFILDRISTVVRWICPPLYFSFVLSFPTLFTFTLTLS